MDLNKGKEYLERLFVSILYNFDIKERIKELTEYFDIREEEYINIHEIVLKLGYKLFDIEEENDILCELIIDDRIYKEYDSCKIINIRVEDEESNRYKVWFVLAKAWLNNGDIEKGLNVHIEYKKDIDKNIISNIMADTIAEELSKKRKGDR